MVLSLAYSAQREAFVMKTTTPEMQRIVGKPFDQRPCTDAHTNATSAPKILPKHLQGQFRYCFPSQPVDHLPRSIQRSLIERHCQS